MKLPKTIINVAFALMAGSLSAAGFAAQRALASNDGSGSPVASDGSDRVGVSRLAADGADRVGANRVASDGAGHVGANRVASDGAGHVGANRVASISLYDTPYSLETSPYFCGACR